MQFTTLVVKLLSILDVLPICREWIAKTKALHFRFKQKQFSSFLTLVDDILVY